MFLQQFGSFHAGSYDVAQFGACVSVCMVCVCVIAFRMGDLFSVPCCAVIVCNILAGVFCFCVLRVVFVCQSVSTSPSRGNHG